VCKPGSFSAATPLSVSLLSAPEPSVNIGLDRCRAQSSLRCRRGHKWSGLGWKAGEFADGSLRLLTQVIH
jgi:hypothetical protein